MLKHLYQRTITKNGKKIKAWYYWFYDENGKQVRKSCGQNGKPCLLKRDAEAFIAALNDDDLKKNEIITFNDFCENFYDENSHFMKKQKSRGFFYQAESVYQKKLYLNKFLERFGIFGVKELKGFDIENWIIDLECCNSVKNNILSVINEVYTELYNFRLVDYIPKITRFKRIDQKSKGILTIEEINRLWPDDYDNLIKIWKILPTELDIETYTFAVMTYLILSTGLRSSEVRALQWNQFLQNDAILINAMIDSSNERVNHLKKGDNDNKKWRVVILSNKAENYMNNLRLMNSLVYTDYCFKHKGERISTSYLLDHFKCVLRKNGIDEKSRNLTVHSLRFTYNTMMKKEISGDDLRLMMGHVSEQMTEYYDKSKALDHLSDLLENKDRINSVFK